MTLSRFRSLPALALAFLLTGCPSDDYRDFGSGDDGEPGGGDLIGDDARRAVLADIGAGIILPSLRAFEESADTLQSAVTAHAAAPAQAQALDEARAAWRAAMQRWQRNEALQVGPAGRNTGLDATPGGAGLRDRIYTYPFRTPCSIDQAALDDAAVDENTAITIRGLGALEYLLFFEGVNPDCPPPDGADLAAKRAQYAERVTDTIAATAGELVARWSPDGDDFLSEWSSAGAGSGTYMRPQAALDALSVALFYVEKETKDRKIAGPTGIGATGVDPCGDANCPERLESRLSMTSGANIRANLAVFRDVFTGVEDGMGVNDLLRGIGRDDLADEVIAELDDTLAQLDALEAGFDAAVLAIPSNEACINASANPDGGGVPACALHGYIRRAMDTFRGPIVAALSLATPNAAAGDND
ncbi:imelysin family protein [Algiphilus sp.]|uniref:imelysin family protein n=1 Tax=Algiphilus sp. TaxID=1872431 RepID=UPI0025BA6ADF|nr:imelysin family protein [Algiphilus sp.]MCK5768811.1 imelysin family protein [Algiphilus sp.]